MLSNAEMSDYRVCARANVCEDMRDMFVCLLVCGFVCARACVCARVLSCRVVCVSANGDVCLLVCICGMSMFVGGVGYLFAGLCAGLFVSECMLAWGGLSPVVCVERCSTNLRSEEDEQDGDS